MITILQTCPLIQLPAHAPAGSPVTTMHQYYFSGFRQFGSGDRRNRMPRMQSEQMIHMPMLVFRIINIYRPFHQLTIPPYFIRNEIGKHMLPLLTFFLIYAQHFTRLDCIQQNLTYNGMYKGSTLIDRAMLRRSRWSSRICSIRFMPQIIDSKVRTTFYQLITRFFQEFQISCIIIILPDMSSQPGTCHRIEVPRHILTFQRSGKSEYIAGNRCRPSSGTEIRFRGLFTRFYQRTNEIDQWKHTFIQVGGAYRPIIHLNIDIIMIVHTPRSIDIIMPDTLQIRRHIARTGT